MTGRLIDIAEVVRIIGCRTTSGARSNLRTWGIRPVEYQQTSRGGQPVALYDRDQVTHAADHRPTRGRPRRAS